MFFFEVFFHFVLFYRSFGFHFIIIYSINYELEHIASQTWVDEPLSNSEHAPSNDDLLDFQKGQQHPPTRARAWTYERKLRPSWNFGRKWLMHMRPHGRPTHGYMIRSMCEEFVLTHHGVWEYISKVCRNCPYVTTKKNDHKSIVVRWEGLQGSSNWFGFSYSSCS